MQKTWSLEVNVLGEANNGSSGVVDVEGCGSKAGCNCNGAPADTMSNMALGM